MVHRRRIHILRDLSQSTLRVSFTLSIILLRFLKELMRITLLLVLDIISYVFGVVWNGIRGAGEAVYYLGYGLINVGQSAWQTLFGAGGGQGGRTVGRAPGGRHPESRSRSSGEDSDEGRAYRRQVSSLENFIDLNCSLM